MDRLSEMEAFIRVVDAGGFTEAAKQVSMSKSAVSKHVAALEARLGAQLLNRTTRRVSPTEIGLAYYDRAARILADAREADAMATTMQGAPRGELRISGPLSFGIRHLAPAVADFLNEYEEISVHLVLDDRFIELIAEGFDMAIRIGDLVDSNLKSRRLAEVRQMFIASEDYLRRHGEPKTPDDLKRHNLLHYTYLSSGNFWRINVGGAEEKLIRASGRLSVNNGEALLHAVERGVGIAMQPSFICLDAIRDGRVREILADVRGRPVGIHAIYPPGRYLQPKIRAFIDFLARRFGGPIAPWDADTTEDAGSG